MEPATKVTTDDPQDFDSSENLAEAFHALEKKCIGYDNYVENTEENYIATLEKMRTLVAKVQSQSLFSPNEEISEIETDNLRLLMAPYYMAFLLFRIMDKREERVKMAHIFYLEYLGMLDHYGVLEKDQSKLLKDLKSKHKVQIIQSRSDASIEEVKEAQELLKELQSQRITMGQDRESKIAEYKAKKMIEQAMDQLKDYRDEDMKREFYMMYIKRSIMETFEQLRTVDMEMQLLRHKATLTPEQLAENDKRSAQPEPGTLPPMQMQTITKESLSKIPYLMRPTDQNDEGGSIVNEYKDPNQRVVVHQDTVDQRVDIRHQYKEQVFRPGHNQPTMSLEEYAEIEMRDAMERDAKEKEAAAIAAAEDPESEEVLERERKRISEMDDWKDYVPKGRGVTKHI